MTVNLYAILHYAGGTFPTGAFSQSWGLETYIHDGSVKDEEGFRRFLRMYTDAVLGGLEGPFFCEAYALAAAGSFDKLPALESQLTALRLTKETRESVIRTGKAMLRIVSEITSDDQIAAYYEKEKQRGISFPIAFAITAARAEVEKEEALDAFLFNAVNGIIQSALKLIPLGNIQAQKILLDFYEEVKAAKEKALRIPASEAFAFCPGLDIASMRHETLPTRLYMS